MLIFDSVHGNFIHFLSLGRVIFDIIHDSLMYLVLSQMVHKIEVLMLVLTVFMTISCDFPHLVWSFLTSFMTVSLLVFSQMAHILKFFMHLVNSQMVQIL